MQWASASTGASDLKAISTGVTSTDYYKAPWYSEGGALSLYTMYGWSTRMGAGHALRDLKTLSDPNLIGERYQEIQVLMNILANPIQHLSKMPLRGQKHLEKHFPLWFEWIDHPSRDQYLVDLAVAEKFEEVKVPALNIGGWYDIFVMNTLETYISMKKKGGSEAARNEQLLIIGPWDHGSQKGIYPERQFGLTASSQFADITTLHRKFYDRWLRSQKDALDGVAPVRIFVMGIDQWRDEQDWPSVY